MSDVLFGTAFSNDTPKRFFYLPSLTLLIHHQPSIITWLSSWAFCSHRDIFNTLFSWQSWLPSNLILVLLVALLNSSLTSLALSNAEFLYDISGIGSTIHKLIDTISSSRSLSSTIIWCWPFQSLDLSSALWRKEHHLWRMSWDSFNQFEPNLLMYLSPMVQNSLCNIA